MFARQTNLSPATKLILNVLRSTDKELYKALINIQFKSAGMAERFRQAAADRCTGVQILLPAPKKVI